MTVPVDFGYWRAGLGQRRLLSWDPNSGAITLDGDPIAICHDEDDLRRRLLGWPDHCDLIDGLGWVATQLQGCR